MRNTAPGRAEADQGTIDETEVNVWHYLLNM
ncbi:hypothetical protein ES707_18160 [subsurface metagenome]